MINWHFNLLIIPGLIIGFTIHELGHALAAYYLGDYSQAKDGKISANPFKHISWLGATLFIFLGIGWPKPISFNAKNFKNRYLDSFLVATAGPFANFATSIIIFIVSYLILWLLSMANQIDRNQVEEIVFFSRASQLAALPFSEAIKDISIWVIAFSNRVWVANFILAFISLIPLPPFDGFTAFLSVVGMFREKRINELTNDDLSPAVSPLITPETSPPKNKKRSMADIHFNLGTDYHQQKQFDDAIARYRQAVSIDATYGPAYVNMGLAYKAKEQRNEAIQAFRAATRYASDEKSKNQGWAELHDLSALSGHNPDIVPTSQNSGSTPWTDVKPSPDWLTFGVGIIVLLLMFICIFGLLLITLID